MPLGPGGGRAGSRPSGWPTATRPPIAACSGARPWARHEDRVLLPLDRLGLEPRERALPPWRRARADRPRTYRERLRAARRLEPAKPHGAVRDEADRGVSPCLPRTHEHALRARGLRCRARARRRAARARPRVE